MLDTSFFSYEASTSDYHPLWLCCSTGCCKDVVRIDSHQHFSNLKQPPVAYVASKRVLTVSGEEIFDLLVAAHKVGLLSRQMKMNC